MDKEVARSLEKDHKKTSLDPFDRNNDNFRNKIASNMTR